LLPVLTKSTKYESAKAPLLTKLDDDIIDVDKILSDMVEVYDDTKDELKKYGKVTTLIELTRVD
jgi:hypothetical protein